MFTKKIKRKLALLAMAALVGASSVNVMASSNARVDRTVTVKTQDILDPSNCPNIKIELDDPVNTGDTFYLTLKNAKWYYSDGDVASYLSSHITTDSTDTSVAFSVTQQSNTIIAVKLTAGNLHADDTITVPVLCKITGSKPSVTIDSDCNISEQSVNLAKVNDNGFTVSVDDEIPSFYDSGQLASFTISEAAIGSFVENAESGKVKIYLYLDSSEFDLGGLNKMKVSFSKGLAGTTASSYSVYTDNRQDNTIIIEIDESAFSTTELNALSVEGLTASLSGNDDDFSAAKLTMDVSVGATSKNIQVGEIVNQGLSVKITPETKWKSGLPAGRESYFTIQLKEGAKDAVANDKNFELSLKKGYFKHVDVTLSKTQILSYLSSIIVTSPNVKITNYSLTGDKVTGLVLSATADDDSYDEYKIKIPYTSFTEDIVYNGEAIENFDETLVIEGRALINKQEVKLAQIMVPFTITYTASELSLGARDQSAPDITIKENVAGAFQKGNINIYFNNDDGVRFSAVPKVEITDGNMKVGNGKLLKSGNKVYGISIPVAGSSKKAATFKISEIKLLTDRTSASGNVGICVGGEAITDDEAFVAENYVSIAGTTAYENTQFNNLQQQMQQIQQTQQQQAQQQVDDKTHVVKFNIDQTAYIVDGETKVMEGAVPFIDKGRTYVPVRYAAEAVGITGQDIKAAGGIITLMGDKVVQVKVGSDVLYLNGVKMQMDAPVVEKEGRTYLPVAWIGSALDMVSKFDDATKSVYLYSKTLSYEQALAKLSGSSVAPSNPISTVPSTTTPSTPSTTVPSTVPSVSTTVPSTTVPSTTVPSTTVPQTTVPSTTTTIPTAQPSTQPTTQPSTGTVDTSNSVIVFE